MANPIIAVELVQSQAAGESTQSVSELQHQNKSIPSCPALAAATTTTITTAAAVLEEDAGVEAVEAEAGVGGGGNYHNQGGHSGGGGFNQGGENIASKAKLQPCRNFTTNGNCSNNNCRFGHVVKLYASLDAANPSQQQNNSNNNFNNNNNNRGGQQLEAVTSVAIWETAGTIKIFTGSHDGFWRLWNTSGGSFVKEFEQQMGGKVECLQVAFNYLFCGFESISPALPDVPVGMVHAWNLASPTQPPLELQMVPGMIPYAHGMAVTSVLVMGADGQPPSVVSGSRDGSIRIWAFKDNAFVMEKNLLGHAREVTGLAPIGNLLWSAGMDHALRIWDNATSTCQHTITAASTDGSQPPAAGNNPGHSHAVTALLQFEAPNNGGTFVLSSSMDGTIQAWNGANGQCVAKEAHGEGVVCMSMAADLKGAPLLLIGLESGNIMVRNVLQSGSMPAFGLLFCLSSRYTASHSGAVRSLCQGPSSTFYSCGNDGKLLVWQLTGDLGL